MIQDWMHDPNQKRVFKVIPGVPHTEALKAEGCLSKGGFITGHFRSRQNMCVMWASTEFGFAEGSTFT